ncbi:DUF3822 family protein [Allomuricauda sp. d1]|uniref:DUF3822 family protein n=1 Tax=Allomuricauda sp. d1 TaxID=3136725 RepID=UPI0031DFF5B9
MTEKVINSSTEKNEGNKFEKLSIQVSLNGLSFCVIDTITDTVTNSGKVRFKAPSTPYLVQKELKSLLEDKDVIGRTYTDISVVHKNNLFALVPKDLFDENELPNYLKMNTKLLAHDHIVFDEISTLDIINVYVPLVNVNNYLFSLFGEFEFKHSGTVLIQTLVSQKNTSRDPVCYAYLTERTIEVVILKQKRLLFYNHFQYHTKEDFLYYILFTFEQLELDAETTALKMFGQVEEDDAVFKLCQDYISKVAVFVPSGPSYLIESDSGQSIDFTILSAL